MHRFGNILKVREYTGGQLGAVLEQQFTNADKARVMFVSGMSYSFDRSKPPGQRIIAPLVNGQPLRDDATYRVGLSGFLGGGGDAFDTLAGGRIVAGGVLDMLANLLYMIATRSGPLSVVVTLASLYPASTVLLARVILHERLNARQWIGIACALVAVVAIVR